MTHEEVKERGIEQMTPVQLFVTDAIGIGFGAITAPELTQAQAEYEARQIAEYRTVVDKTALAICIDGRPGSFLGPKIAGGFKTLEVAMAALRGGYDVSGAQLLERAKSRGFSLGAHVDATNKASGFASGTGCGANDKEAEIDRLFNENAATLKPTVKTLVTINSVFDGGLYEDTHLSPTTDDVNHLRTVVGEDAVETLADDGEGVHGHTEWTVYFNFQDGTTIDRDAYFGETGKKVFVVDMWYLKRLADAMAEGVDAQSQAAEIYQAMVDFQVGTYIALCDGKHRAVIATDEQQIV